MLKRKTNAAVRLAWPRWFFEVASPLHIPSVSLAPGTVNTDIKERIINIENSTFNDRIKSFTELVCTSIERNTVNAVIIWKYLLNETKGN